MLVDTHLLAGVFLALLVALAVSFLASPVVKAFAYKVGAIDVPKDNRRMHHVPIPRLGGLAIFLGFIVSILLFVEMTSQFRSILLGAVIIVVLGAGDDITPLPAKLKFLVQIGAALIPTLSGVRIHVLSNPNLFSPNPYWDMGALSVPVTVLWIVAITNAVNLIDGLDGLASGVSLVYALTMSVIFFYMSVVMRSPADMGQAQQTQYAAELNSMAIFAAAVAGGCLGFLRYNSFPARVFMGDTGSLALGGAIAAMAIFSRAVLLLPIMGACFVASAISVILQVGSYKLRRKRIFKMAPLHHHFELLGYSETRIVSMYMIMTTVLCLVSLLAFQ